MHIDKHYYAFVFSSSEPKAHGEIIVWYSNRRPCLRPCVRRSHFQTSSSLKPLSQSKPNFI